jgi:bacterioferritin
MSANLSSFGVDAYPFLSEVVEIRRRARLHIQDVATAEGEAERDAVLPLLDEALAAELLRYRRHYSLASGAVAESLKKGEFLRYAQEERGHADRIAQRIRQLGGLPNLAPPSLGDDGGAAYLEDEDDTLADLVAEDLIAERIAIDNYRDIIRYLGDKDAATRGLFESILAVEQQHVEELVHMREQMLGLRRAAAGADGGNGKQESGYDG